MISHIVAIDKFGGTARDGGIPWDLPDDRARMWQRTMELGGKILISFSARQGIPRFELPMPTYLWTHGQTAHPDYKLAKNEQYVTDLKEFFDSQVDENIVVLGGAKLYNATLELGKVSVVDLTYIDADFQCDSSSNYPLHLLSNASPSGFNRPKILATRKEKNLKITQYLYEASQKMNR